MLEIFWESKAVLFLPGYAYDGYCHPFVSECSNYFKLIFPSSTLKGNSTILEISLQPENTSRLYIFYESRLIG